MSAWRGRLSQFYYEDLREFIGSLVSPQSSVLDTACRDGSLLASLQPSRGVGLSPSGEGTGRARERYPGLRFEATTIRQLPVDDPFDYVVVPNVVGQLSDCLRFFRTVSSHITESSTVIVTYYNFVWEPVLNLAQVLRLKRRDPIQNWLSRLDLVNLLELSGFEVVASGHRTPFPLGPGRLARPLNDFLTAVPPLRRVGITSYAVARRNDRPPPKRQREPRTTVVIPTRNERGNIRDAINRLPRLGASTEVIFVDGHSTDGTADEIRRLIDDRPDRMIKLIDQGDGVGKGDAVRKGFSAAQGDVLMILDADLTVAPEDLIKFFTALVEGKGDFINGTRLVYPMEGEAMRLANIAGNKIFSVVFSWILRQRITDTLCGTKVLWASDYRRIAANREKFGDFDPFGDFDLLFGAADLGLRIRELPIRYRRRTYGETKISRWRHGVLLLGMALKGARRLRFAR